MEEASSSATRKPRQALAYACVHDRRGAADWLLDHEANPNAICHGFAQPCTALHLVIQHTRAHDIEERWKMIEWLLDHGSDPSVRDPIHDGDALGWARSTGPKGALIEPSRRGSNRKADRTRASARSLQRRLRGPEAAGIRPFI